MERYLITLSYDGHLFKGWQIQNNQRTVQEELEKAVSKIAKTNVRVVGSGRTDSGVHALGQCAHFDLPFSIGATALTKALNCILPDDIRILESRQVDSDFHARYDAYKRCYIYKFSFQKNPFTRFYTSVITRKRFNCKIFEACLHKFEGEHDFIGFSKFNPDVKSTICFVDKINYITTETEHIVYISANRFLHNMVRRIIGTSINISHENADPSIITDLLINFKDENPIVYTAPPQGLYLEKVYYKM